MNPRDMHLIAAEVNWIEAKAAQGEGPSIPRFSMLAYTGGPMIVKGWDHPVVIELSGLEIPNLLLNGIRLGLLLLCQVAQLLQDGLTLCGLEHQPLHIDDSNSDGARDLTCLSRNLNSNQRHKHPEPQAPERVNSRLPTGSHEAHTPA